MEACTVLGQGNVRLALSSRRVFEGVVTFMAFMVALQTKFKAVCPFLGFIFIEAL